MLFRRWVFVAAALALPVLAGCTEIVRAEFGLPSGELLASGPLPGPPPGDFVAVAGEVVASGSGISLRLRPGEPRPRLDLITGGKPHKTSAYWIVFHGLRLSQGETPVMVVEALDEHAKLACRVEIAGGEFKLVGGAGPVVIGEYSTAAVHHVLLRVDKLASKCLIYIEQGPLGAGADPELPQIVAETPLADTDFNELDLLRFRWEQVGPDDNTQYFVDDVVVGKQD